MNITADGLVGGVELTLLVIGVVLLWRFVLSPTARAQKAPSPLPPWDVPLPDFMLFGVFTLMGSFALVAGVSLAARALGLHGDGATIFATVAMHLGMLGGALLAPINRGRCTTSPTNRRVLLSGLIAFLISFPIVALTAKASEYLVQLSGLTVERQDLIGMFARADSSWLLAAMITGAIVIAPINEEIVFRAGVFRYLRTRFPRWLALTLPALSFAILHVNWKTLAGLESLPPLVVLAVLFSLAYERTGHIGTPIVAHALFNLNTVLVVLSGVDLK